MALKLGKCRLCLKLGDFYSIFTVDNSVQLAEMVMECSRVKVYEGDGLPDKVCSECIQKLSSAYIFKQQCERADQELRRNYVPPPGFSVTPPPNRQSSDSAFSNHTDLSNQTKPSSSTEKKATPANRSRKRSRESIDNVSVASRSQDNSFKANASKQRTSETKGIEKRPRLEPDNISGVESDYEDNNSASHFSADYTDSDEPLINHFSCDQCGKSYEKKASLLVHKQWHNRARKSDTTTPKKPMGENAVVEIPKASIEDSQDDDDKLSCEKCGKTFKLKIMLKRHADSCVKASPLMSPKKELLIALEPISPIQNSSPIPNDNRLSCEMCTTRFKTVDNLEKHMRIVHAAVLKKKDSLKLTIAKNDSQKVPVPCIFCSKPFDDYYQHAAHYNACPLKTALTRFECTVCQKNLNRKDAYFIHIKNFHFEPRCIQQSSSEKQGTSSSNFQCRICSKKLATQEQLITHLAAHVSNIEDAGSVGDEESRASTAEDDASLHSDYSANVSRGPLNCKYCDKQFTYKKALMSHEMKHTTGEIEIKVEPPDPDISTTYEETLTPTPKAVAVPRQGTASKERKVIYRDTESDDSSQDDGDNTCDICEKMFSYKRLLIQHKRTKHNMSSGTKRAKILLKDCKVKCLICDLEMTVNDYKEHNQTHIASNLKPRNLYTCIDCEDTFKSCQSLATHIKLVHRLNKQVTKKVAIPDLADFCEVVVTKTEPLDEIQSHNGFGEVPASGDDSKPIINLSGFTCPICSKKMQTLISLKRHVNWHTNVGNNLEKKIECFVCKEQFRFKGHFRIHMREHYTDPNLDPKFLICSICNRKSKHLRAAQAHMNFHKQTRFKAQDYQCSICKRIFQDRKVYLSHMAIHYKRGDTIQNTVVGDYVPHNKPAQSSTVANTCPYCNKVCESEVSLKHHMSWHKSKTALYGGRHECPFCNLQFTNKRRQELHLRTHFEDDNGPYKCNVCGKGYNDEEYFRRHVKGHNFDHQSHKKRIAKLRENKVKCPICSRYYPDVVKLIRHLRRTHPQSKMIKADPDAPPQQVYSCKLCAKVFLDERRLQFHEEAHLRKPEFFKCKFCGKKTISLKNHNVHIKSHLVRKHIDNPLKCYKCEEHFIRGYDLHYHLRDTHKINETWIAERGTQTLDGPLKELQCSICLKVLASQGNFERHIDYHNTLRCNYCHDYFSSLRFLEGHLAFSCEKKKLIGDTEPHPRKIKCHICYKAFHLQVKLDCHLKTQHDIKVSREAREGKKEIACDYCFKVFENEYALSTHKIYHRTVGYYGCLYCDRKFNNMTVYRKHKNHHFSQLNVDNPTKCEHCDETFVAFREMIYHMKDAHGDDKEWIVMPKESIEEECNICGKIFFNISRHLVYHEENRCKKCKEYFYSRVEYDNHLCSIESDDEQEYNNTADGPKYEECVFCFKGLTKTSSKLKHDLIHRGSGAISCRFCLLKFKTMDAFNIHAFSHRSRKYNKKPIKCRICKEKFVKYGPFMKHMKVIHKSKEKMHYRAIVKPERCVVCGEDFPNLHNHYRAHMQNQCQKCNKYFTSVKVFNMHQCDKEDIDPTKVFVSDENLVHLINTYVPKDLKDDEKYYGMSDDEDDEQIDDVKDEKDDITIDTASQNSQDSAEVEHLVPLSIQSPIISDVLSLYQERPHELMNMGQEKDNDADGDCVIDLSDDDCVDIGTSCPPTVTIDD